MPTPAGNQLRHAARLIAAYAYLTQERASPRSCCWSASPAALAEAVAELRDSQQRAAQAAAALRAAQHLRTATRPAPPDTRPPGRPATATPPPAPKPARPRPAGLAQLSFPAPPGTRPSVPGQAARLPATRHRHADRRHHGHAAPPDSIENTYGSPTATPG